jgi:hypothetical protein
MKTYTPVCTIVGYLDNLSFYEPAEEFAKGKMDSSIVRRHMFEEIEDRFKRSHSPFSGPGIDCQYPLGGYWFKTPQPSKKWLSKNSTATKDNYGKQELQKYILQKMGLESLEITTLFTDFPVKLGFIVMKNPEDDRPQEVNFWNNDILNLAHHVAAFQRQRSDETTSYFHLVDEEFDRLFPADKDLDYD